MKQQAAGVHTCTAWSMNGSARTTRKRESPRQLGVAAVSVLAIAAALDYPEHLFISDESPPMRQLIAVDGQRELPGLGRQAIVAVGELPPLARRGLAPLIVVAAVNERTWFFQLDHRCHGKSSQR